MPNPLLDADNILGVGAFITTIGGLVWGVVKWVGAGDKAVADALAVQRVEDMKTVEAQRLDDIAIHAGAHALLDQRIANVEHKANNERMRTDAIEKIGEGHTGRIIRLEGAVQNIEKGVERIEDGQKEARRDAKERFDELAKSIREIREVKPKRD